MTYAMGFVLMITLVLLTSYFIMGAEGRKNDN